MEIIKSHSAQRRALRHHTFRGEASSFLLIEWLNSARDAKGIALKRAYSRVNELLRAAQDITVLDRVGDYPKVQLWSGRRSVYTEAQGRNWRRRVKLQKRLNSVLAKIRTYPQYVHGLGTTVGRGPGEWVVAWRRTGSSDDRTALEILVSDCDSVPFSEIDATMAIVRLGELGAVHKICSCRMCGRWLFARYHHRVFCGQPCQLKAWRDSDEYRATHRADERRRRLDKAEQERRWLDASKKK